MRRWRRVRSAILKRRSRHRPTIALRRLLQHDPGAAVLLRQPGHLDLAQLDAGSGLLDLGSELCVVFAY